MKTLANPHRLMIVCRLIEGDQCVGGLAADLDLQQTLVSQHLAILRRQRVVEARRAGQTIRYRLSSGAARAVAETLAAHFCAFPASANRAN
ncbi:MAG: winged helix-turn-helix transcriptional regulator [Hyphomonadaceae bacterium]|nr:winged helix-turn-helix transcriptional regulator [Hyphomonadaceae bacterium]